MLYKVVWADAVVVEATDPAAAWAEYCKQNEAALKHPNLHDRFVFVAEPNTAAPPPSPAPVSFEAKKAEPAPKAEAKHA